MQGNYTNRLVVFGLAGAIVLAGMIVASAAPAESRMPVLRSVMKEPVGLVVDNRANAYTADRATGRVFCLAANSEPVHFATVEGQPTALAVDNRRTVFVGTTSGQVHAVSRDGVVKMAYQCDAPIAGLDVDRDGGLLIATQRGAVIKVDRAIFE